jgi:hypothetical protein
LNLLMFGVGSENKVWSKFWWRKEL